MVSAFPGSVSCQGVHLGDGPLVFEARLIDISSMNIIGSDNLFNGTARDNNSAARIKFVPLPEFPVRAFIRKIIPDHKPLGLRGNLLAVGHSSDGIVNLTS